MNLDRTSDIQVRIHHIWSVELRLTDFTPTDDFFDLGGHSLIMARIQESLAKEFDVEPAMDELFRRSTVADAASYVQELRASRSSVTQST